ncbi:hypothetical protein [Lactococcus petauri]|uniref:hypothetical protein n=1 Tax=Lactococcus petauri TaxID=1940789 RepID=UPI0038521D8F
MNNKHKDSRPWISIGISIFGICLSFFIFLIGRSFSNDHQPLDYKLSLSQSNSEKINGYTLAPTLDISLDRNDSGLEKEIFLADFDSKNNIVITPTSSSKIDTKELLDKIIPKYKEIAKNSTDSQDYILKLAKQSSEYLNYDYSITHQEASLTRHYSLFFQEKSVTVNFFDGNITLYHQQHISPKFIILKGANNSYQILTFFYILNKTTESDNDVQLSFNGLELFSETYWSNILNNSNLTTNEKKQLEDLKKDTQDKYDNVLTFLKAHTL